MRSIIIVLALLFATSAQAQQIVLRIVPDGLLTPGAIDPSLTPKYLCSHPTSDRRRVPKGLRTQVFAAYKVPISKAANFEVDHFIPLSLGGVNTCPDNPTCNLWPEPYQKSYRQVAPWGSETKDKLEGLLYRTMWPSIVSSSSGSLTPLARFCLRQVERKGMCLAYDFEECVRLQLLEAPD